MDAAFQCPKAWICQTLLNTNLTHYDHSKPIIKQRDKYGLGATFLQSGWPITFARKTLTDVKVHYTYID